MITARAFAGKHYAVYGLARSGIATIAALLASGAKVTAWDGDPEKVEEIRSSRAQSRDSGTGVSTSLDTNGLEFADLDSADLSQFDSLVVTPGLPLNRHPIAARARAAGVEIIGDIELFARARAELPPHKVVGITGTNGKSTTTALVHHILQTAGVPSAMGGNIGLPILAQEPLPKGGVYVLELSSYQMDLTQSLDCDVAVLLNITPDHLDRYASFEAYAASKNRLLLMQSSEHKSVVNWPAFERGLINPESAGFNGIIPLKCGGQLNWPELQGPHNAENADAARQACGWLGIISDAQIERGLRTYPGLPHRMERIREQNGVTFVNDSKATNPTATAPALAAFDHIRWILGGQAKTDNLDECAPSFGHVRAAYTIGEAGELFASLLSPHMPVTKCETLENAVNRAAKDSQAGETVLLSPACASFDQFSDFEQRGDRFRELVEAL
ncbi:MAG: UDP-N-acetylmuramoyl-L-alanine--D-glutamate ligase [Sphingomonas sp.]|nr:UDP-N-acetylmuramoyl-L-alanine--D-glutamate ligase [Sphingomonas sp.]